MDIINLLRDIGVFGLAMWFIQLLLTKSADRKFEAYKNELNHKTREFQLALDSKAELFKAELNLRNYKTTKTYERQLNTIIDIYKKLVKLNIDMQQMTALLKLIIKDGEQEEIDRIKNAGESYNDFFNFYLDNKIFFPKDTVAKLENIRNDFFISYNDYIFGRQYGIKDKSSYEKAREAGERIKEKIQPAIDQLELDFKELIGVEK